MRLRTYLSLAVLALVVATAIVLPGTPAVRGAVVGLVLEQAEAAGYAIAVDGTAGNLWRGFTLRGVEVAGPGANATAESVRVRYFLPPLLTGDLPVGLRVVGLDGTVDVGELTDAVLAEPASAPPAVRVRVQDVDVSGSRLTVAGIPFTLPDVGVEGMRISTASDRITAGLDLVTAEGKAELVVTTRLGSDTIDIDVVAADAAIARHWWAGIEGGTGRGAIRIRDGVVTGDLEVEGGSLTALGVGVREISGPIAWRGTDIDAALAGIALGGRISATGRVDVLAQRWHAVGSAEGDLEEVVAALWGLGAPGSPLPSRGTVRAGVRAEGWTLAHVEVDALANGSLLGEPLDDLGASVVWDSLAGLSVDAGGGWAGGRADARVRSVGGASEVEAGVRGATLAGIAVDRADASFRLGAEPRGQAAMVGSWDGPLGPLAIESDLTLDADGASLFLHGDAGDLVIEGAVVAPGLHGDAPLDGSVQVRTPPAWWGGSEAPPVSLAVRGALAAPRVDATIGGPSPARPDLPGMALDVDLRGTVTAELVDGGIDVDGALGPFGIGGGWGGDRRLVVAADAVAFVDPVRALLSDLRAELSPDAGGWRLRADAELGAMAADLPFSTIRLEPLGRVTLEGDAAGLALRDDAGRIELVAGDGVVRASFDELSLSVADVALSVTASAERGPDGDWRGAGRLAGAGIDARIELEGPDATVEADVAAGAVIGPWRPAVDVAAAGRLDAAGFELEAQAGSLSATASGTFAAAGAATWEATLHHAEGRIDAAGAGGGWTARGALPVDPLLQLAGVAAAPGGSVAIDLAAPAGGEPAGTASVATLHPAPLDAEIVIGGGRADAVATGSLLGQELDARGQIWPAADATLHWGPIGPVRLSGDGAGGSGTVPGLALAAVRIPEQPWSLDLDLGAATATARVGATEATASWAGGAAARVRVDQPLDLAGAAARVTGDVTWSSADPAGAIALRLDAPSLGLTASLEGDLDDAEVRASGPAGALADALGAPAELAGDVSILGTASLLTPSARLQAQWRAGGDLLEADVDVGPDGWAGSLVGPGVTAEATREEWSVAADAFEPGRWLVAAGGVASELGATVDGELHHDGRAWSGALRGAVGAPLPVAFEVRGEGEALHVEANADGTWYEASLVGRWGDAPRFELEARVMDPTGAATGGAEARGTIALTDGAWSGRGAVTATEGDLGPVTWPALVADWALEDGRLRMGGSSGLTGLMTLDGGDVRGAWQLPIAFGGLDHRLRIEAGDETTATIDGPSLRLAVGPSPEGGWRLVGTADALDAWGGDAAPTMPWASSVGPVAVDAHAVHDGDAWRWDLRASTAATLEGTVLPLALGASGAGASGSGTLEVGPGAAPAARVTLELADGVPSATVDGDDVDVAAVGRLLDLPIAGAITGRASVGLAEGGLAGAGLAGGAPARGGLAEARLAGSGLDVRGDLRADLTYDGTPFGVELRRDASGGWRVHGETDGATWSASVSAPDAGSLAAGGATVLVNGPETALRGRLVADDDAYQLRLGGSAVGRTVSLALAGDARAVTGNATWGASRLDVDLGPERLSARGHVARGDAPAGPWSIALDVDREAWHVDRLSVRSAAAGASLDLRGQPFPVDLTGTASWSDIERPVSLRRLADDGWRLGVDALGFTLDPDGRVQAEGAASVTTSGARIDVDLGTLAWHGGAGWEGEGSASVSVADADVAVAVSATGSPPRAGGAPGGAGGPLRLEARIHRAGSAVGDARLDVPADLAGDLDGDVDLDLTLAGEGTDAWRLSAAGPIAGTLGDPRLDADLRLTGPVDARGRLRFAGDSLRADLAGESLAVSGRLDGSGWLAQARVSDADAAAFLPWLDRARLDLALEARSGPGGVEIVADTLRISGPSSSVAGRGRLSPGGELRVTLQSDVQLADLRVGTDVAGRVHGPLTLRYDIGTPLTDADVTGMLGVAGVAVDGVPGTFSGDLQVSGPAADPRLLATLQAGGEATGTLRADLRPRRGTGRVDADLQVGPLHAALRAALDEATLSADGRVAFDGFALALASEGGGVALSGQGSLAGWTGRLEAYPWSLDLAGDLAAVTPLAEGAVEAALTWPEGGGITPEVTGSWGGVAVGPIALPDAAIVTAGDGALAATAPGLAARLHLPSLAWSLELADAVLELGDERVSLGIDAAGTGWDSRAAARLDGSWQGHPVDLTVDLAARAAAGERLSLQAAGALLGGEARLDVTRDAAGSWSGVGALVDAIMAGEPLEVSTTLSGAGATPDVAAAVRWGDGLLVADADLRDGRLEAHAAAALPGADDVTASGSLWPRIDLAIASGASPEGGARVRGSAGGEPLTVEGAVAVDVGGVRISLLEGVGGTPRLELAHPDLPDVSLAAELPHAAPADLFALVARDGLAFEVEGDGEGRVVLAHYDGAWAARLEAVALGVAGARVQAEGRLAPGAGAVDLRLDLVDAAGAIAIPGLPLHEPIEGRLLLEGSVLRLTTAAPWSTITEVDLQDRTARLDGDLRWEGPDGASRIAGRLALDAVEGVRGTLDVQGVHLALPGAERGLRVDGAVRGTGGALEVDATARSRRSSVGLTGTLPLSALAGAGWGRDDGRTLDATARVSALDLAELPWLAEVAPGVTGIVSGSVVARGGQLIGQLVADELALAGTELPATLTLAGDASGIDTRLELGTRRQAVLTGAWRDGAADLLVRLERFPVHTVVESIVGRSDVTALVTGVARAGWDPSRGDPFDLRLATEDIRLERAGVVTTGNVTFELADGALVIREASFTGSGAWSARGEIRPDRLDLELVAQDADFGPLLGLIPAFARYGVAAEGDLELVGRGTLADPTLRLRSDGLRVGVAGTSYELSEGALDLVGESLDVSAVVRGVAPLGGEVRLSGDGIVRLRPFDLVRVDLRAVGDLDVPVIGHVTDVDAEVLARSGAEPTLRVDARLGEPLRIEGTLAPFDVRGVGRGLVVGVPDVFVASATVDADLRARVDDGIVVDGRIDVAQARLDLSARAEARAGTEPPPEEVRDEASRRAALQLLRFDGVRILAPQRVTLSETIGTAEAAVDLTLTGDAADPRLEGTVSALRGTFRFSGQDLELVRGVARFEPARGILPLLEIEARARFEKARVAPGGDIRFAAPSGPRFDVVLRFEAEVSTSGPGGAVGVDLVPQLTSDALIEVASGPDGLSAGTRPLSELELLSLIALGRIEVGGGTETLAGAVAQRAIDTAVDLLVVAELQAALSEALGLDVVEIRTTALSDLFDGRSDPFSVSLRFGGYLSDELFASYRVGTFDDAEREFAVTNELAFTYELGPVAFDLAGRIDFPSIATSAPVPSLTASVRYDVSRSFAFEAGLDVESRSQTARFGVTIRW